MDEMGERLNVDDVDDAHAHAHDTDTDPVKVDLTNKKQV